MGPIRIAATLVLAAGLFVAASQEQANPPRDSEPEILTRGPIHEAFALSVAVEAKAGPLISKAPPQALEEIPPDQKPEGEDVEWIPGYWFWDDERNDFIWISGSWRVPPPNMQWVPGAWHEVNGKWQWTSGFWYPVNQTQVEYLPTPPAEPENVPASQAPGDNYTYVPGTWVYHENRYQWRPGFWVEVRQDWVYIPATYIWSPIGYVFVEGYWDYPLESRGLIFAPVYIAPALYAQRAFVYRPSYVIYDTALFGALFVRTGYRSYFFGDYFDTRYTQYGYRSWIDVHIGRSYDPLWNYYRYAYATHDPRWATNITNLYQGRFRGEIQRPARTFAQQTALVGRGTAATHSEFLNIAAPIDRVDSSVVRLTQVNQTERQQAVTAAQEFRQASTQRTKVEAQARTSGTPGRAGGQTQPIRLQVPTRQGGTERPPSTTPGAPTRPGDRPPADRPSSKTPETPTRPGDRPPADRPPADRPSSKTPEPPARPGDRPPADRPSSKTPDTPSRPADRPPADRPSSKTPEPPSRPADRPPADRPSSKTPEPPSRPADRPPADRPSSKTPDTPSRPADRPPADRPSSKTPEPPSRPADRPPADRPSSKAPETPSRPADRPPADRPASKAPETRPSERPSADRPPPRPSSPPASRPSTPPASRPATPPPPRPPAPQSKDKEKGKGSDG